MDPEETELEQAEQDADEMIAAEAKRIAFTDLDSTVVRENVVGKLRAVRDTARSLGYSEDKIQRMISSRRVGEMLVAEEVAEAKKRALIDGMLKNV